MSEVLTVSPKEAAHALGIGQAAIYRLLRMGTLPSVKVGRRPNYRVPVRVLEDVLEVWTQFDRLEPAETVGK